MMHEAVKKIIEGCNGSTSISNDYLFDNRLKCTERVVYTTMNAISHNPEHPEYCYPRQDTLAALIGISVRTLQRAITKLVLCGYLIVKRRGSMSNLYYIVAKMGQKIVNKVKDKINTVKNTYKNKKQSTFNNYKQRNYDFSKLEDLILNGNGNYNDCLKE